MATLSGATERYSWRETSTELELSVPLPLNTKRSQLQVTLLDAASGENLWATRIETAGGAPRLAENAVLRVRPMFLPEAVVDGVLRGVVDVEASSYEMVSTTGGGAWDGLVITLRKPAGGGWWEGVVKGEGGGGGGGASARAADPASLVLRMMAHAQSAAVQVECALGCVAQAAEGKAAELVSAKALAQVATAMAQHPEERLLQLAGCALLAAAPMSTNGATTAAVVESRLLGACVKAMWRTPNDEALHVQGARALLRFVEGGKECVAEVVAAEGVSLATGMLRLPSPARDLACEVLRRLATSGRPCQLALVQQGGAASLLQSVASEAEPASWRVRCLLVLHSLLMGGDVDVIKWLLSSGLLRVLLSLGAALRSERNVQLLIMHQLGALTWRSNSASLRASLTADLKNAGAAQALIAASRAHPECEALRVASVKMLLEVSDHVVDPYGTKRLVGNTDHKAAAKLSWGELTQRKPTPAVPQPKNGKALKTSSWNPRADDDPQEAPPPEAPPAPVEPTAAVPEEALVKRLVDEAEAAAQAEAAAGEREGWVERSCRFLLDALAERPVDAASSEAAASRDEPPRVASGAGVVALPAALREVHAAAVDEAKLVEELGLREEAAAAAEAAAELESEAAVEVSRGQTVKCIYRMALESSAEGELQRRWFFQLGGQELLLRAMRRHARHGDRVHQLCAALAQLSTSEEQQVSLLHLGLAVRDLIEMHEDALVSGLDASAHRMRREVGICLSNIAHGPEGQRETVEKEGAQEALEEAVHDCDGLNTMSLNSLVNAMDESQHNAVLQLEACRLLSEQLASAMSEHRQTQTCAEFIDAGVVRSVTRALLRHLGAISLVVAALKLLGVICRWQPSAALLLRGTRAVTCTLRLLDAALDRLNAPLSLAAAELLHWVAVAQVVLSHASSAPALLEPVDAAAPLQRLSSWQLEPVEKKGKGDEVYAQNKQDEKLLKLGGRHARRALSWLLSYAPAEWDRLRARAGKGLDSALEETLAPDLADLATEGIARAIRAHPTHLTMLRDASEELRHRLTSLTKPLQPGKVIELQVMPLMLRAIKASDTFDPAVAAAAGAVLGLASQLSLDGGCLEVLMEHKALSVLLPYMTAASPPPHALLNGSLLLANALHLRDGVGTLQQRAEEQKRALIERERGEFDAREAERQKLLQASMPVLLRVIEHRGDAENEALCRVLDVLHKLATNPSAVSCLVEHGALGLALSLLVGWPEQTSLEMALDAVELVRLLLLKLAGDETAERNQREHEASTGGALTVTQEEEADDDLQKKEKAIRPERPERIAVFCGEHLVPMLRSLAELSSKYATQEDDSIVLQMAKSKLQRALAALEAALLSGAKAGANLDDPELAALRPLIALMKTHRGEPEVQWIGCQALADLSQIPVLAKEVARVGSIKTILLAMKSHIKNEEVQAEAVRAIQGISVASDGCRKLLVDNFAVPMLIAVMKRHSLVVELQRNGCVALTELILGSNGEGRTALQKEREGVEVMVSSMLLCAAEGCFYTSAQIALQSLADADASLVSRIARANGKKYLRKDEIRPKVDSMPQGTTPAFSASKEHDGALELT
ncbi:hypothetical protein AB1Y20_000764 [Prymnesium parvum]|uniref:CS domain-containing protein n=1 Tax=Prymnesium parvum TaxID=97485 RepID=A0AB34K9G8_PRYPA